MKKTFLGVLVVLLAGTAAAAESASGGGIVTPELVQLVTLMVNGVLVPLIGKALQLLSSLERRVSFIEGKLKIIERAEP